MVPSAFIVARDRVRVRVPEPQVSVHAPHSDHSAHPKVVVVGIVVVEVVVGAVEVVIAEVVAEVVVVEVVVVVVVEVVVEVVVAEVVVVASPSHSSPPICKDA